MGKGLAIVVAGVLLVAAALWSDCVASPRGESLRIGKTSSGHPNG